MILKSSVMMHARPRPGMGRAWSIGALTRVATETPELTAHGNARSAVLAAWAAPMRYKVQFTATEEYVGSMNEALVLLSHEMASRDIAEIHARAMQALVAELRKKKRAETDRPRSTTTPRRRVTKDANRNRHVPAEVRRQVCALRLRR